MQGTGFIKIPSPLAQQHKIWFKHFKHTHHLPGRNLIFPVYSGAFLNFQVFNSQFSGGICLRGLDPLFQIAGLSFEEAYPAIAWLCWVPNLLIAEWWLVPRVAGQSQGRQAAA